MESSKEKLSHPLTQEAGLHLTAQAAVWPQTYDKRSHADSSLLVSQFAGGVSSSMNEVSQNTSLRDTLPNGHISS